MALASRAAGWSFKKSLLASEVDRPDVARHRARWQARQGSVDPSRLVFVDETWARINMAALRGWGPRGARLRGHRPPPALPPIPRRGGG